MKIVSPLLKQLGVPAAATKQLQHTSPAAALPSAMLTVLTAFANDTVKRFDLDEAGLLKCVPYGQESHFKHELHPVSNIAELGQLVTALSTTQNTFLIRGQAVPGLPKPIRRRTENFPEHNDGCRWVMLDFDDLPCPEGMAPTSREAVEHVVGKLPLEFHDASYFYQFSSSAGIVKPDGTALKVGLNMHLFFWFNEPVPGKSLDAHLALHCIRTGFYEKAFDRAGHPIVRAGIDPAVLRSSVQPHYVGLPIIGAGVTTTISLAERQGLVVKGNDSVVLPPFEEDVQKSAAIARKKLLQDYKRECGFVEARLVTRAAHGGISVSTYHRKVDGRSPSANRVFIKAVPYDDQAKSVILHFDEEGSPGSWFVTQASPMLARRFGDFSCLPLKELSEGAYVHVRDVLNWFSDVTQNDGMPLTADGYLPSISSFIGNVQNVLIEAPTGSGKSYAFSRFANSNRRSVVLYAAQTRALVRQMYDDLAAAGVPVVHYNDFSPGTSLGVGVYVTTNESLGKFVDAATDQGKDYILVVDEVHMALDDFMKTDAKNRLFERAIGRARRSLFMTATITPLQVQKLLEAISRACGALSSEMYAGFKFASVKSNPLILKRVGELGADFVALMRSYRLLKANKQPIPRTVMIVPTSKMRLFDEVLEAFGLQNDSLVVSRQEATPAEIEEARTSAKPILISSPMFALGLNFLAEPLRFWTYFSHLPVDTSQIIQTLNRANRGTAQCEVRLYYGALDPKPYSIPRLVEERAKIAGYLLDESTVQGVIDTHFQVDRPAYNSLRKAEQKTAKATAHLIQGEGFQNYRIDHVWQETLVRDRNDAQLYKGFKELAAESYMDEISEHAARLEGESTAMLLYKLELLDEEERLLDRRTDGRVHRDIETETRAVMMVLCGIADPEDTARVKPKRLRRLFGELRPYLTSQFSSGRTSSWREATVEKTTQLVPLLRTLKTMRAGQLGGQEFASKMRRPELRAAVKALADSEANFLQVWQPKLSNMDRWSEEMRISASAAKRIELRQNQLEVAVEFLRSIGVLFANVKIDGRWEADPRRPLVPDWEFDEMALNLERTAESLKEQPAERIKPHEVDEALSGPPVNPELCQRCVHRKPAWACALGMPVYWSEIGDSWAVSESCDFFKRLPVRLVRKQSSEREFRVLPTYSPLPGSVPI
ncbi:DEAD/DEAH box helicase family protein [Massilia sp. DWR3-1-1]|uniref:DEAD/DEAH box helicase family protein n=1 Tax=Massilia sp. DWR3-1-1 TaxID=2804559 RepID=UPI003CF43587